ncbi:protein kinase domain-containing protein, partial [Virgisporangium aliadipatigenens]|uniref:protein kinase domain-containing protein n=1 Tax=Virgisporangium aliadipatigenens TaxID=741659 RepID=UPI00194544F6
EPLSERLAAAGTLPPGETLSIVAQAAEALHAAHASGVVHRDVKPGNLIVEPDGRVMLVDFGIARSAAVTAITQANAVPGTALYMSPEQVQGKPVSPATDIYALGAVTYQCLVGEPPFNGTDAIAVAVKHLNDEVPPLPDSVPAPARALVDRALCKDPEGRFPTAAAFAVAARAAANGQFSPGTSALGATQLAAPAQQGGTRLDLLGGAVAGSAAVPPGRAMADPDYDPEYDSLTSTGYPVAGSRPGATGTRLSPVAGGAAGGAAGLAAARGGSARGGAAGAASRTGAGKRAGLALAGIVALAVLGLAVMLGLTKGNDDDGGTPAGPETPSSAPAAKDSPRPTTARTTTQPNQPVRPTGGPTQTQGPAPTGGGNPTRTSGPTQGPTSAPQPTEGGGGGSPGTNPSGGTGGAGAGGPVDPSAGTG